MLIVLYSFCHPSQFMGVNRLQKRFIYLSTCLRSHIVSAQARYHWISSPTITRLADVTSHISSTASSFLQCLSLLSLSDFIPSPLHLIPFPPVPLPSTSRIPLILPLFLSPPFLLTFLFFLYCSTSHTPSCCSKSLKGTELVGAVAVVMEVLEFPAEGRFGCKPKLFAQALLHFQISLDS